MSANKFELQAKLTTGETVTVTVAGYSTIEQGASALLKLATVETLSQVIAGERASDGWDDDVE